MSVVSPAGPRRRSPFVYLPLVVFVGLAVLFGLRLFAGDASRLPSALIGRPVPAFSLPPLEGIGEPGLADADLRAGHVTVVNVFASWCVPCRQESAQLLALKAAGTPLVGIAYKDEPEKRPQLPRPGRQSVFPHRRRPQRPHGHRLGRLRRARKPMS